MSNVFYFVLGPAVAIAAVCVATALASWFSSRPSSMVLGLVVFTLLMLLYGIAGTALSIAVARQQAEPINHQVWGASMMGSMMTAMFILINPAISKLQFAGKKLN